MKGWYRENKEAHIARVGKNNARYYARNRQIVDEIKSAPCLDCGRVFPPCAMDFDHISDDKVDDISRMVTSGVSEDTLRLEISKCEVVCACCHRVRTHNRREEAKAIRI